MLVESETFVSAVLRQLKKAYPAANLYRDEQNQNTKRPCFFVNQLRLGSEKQMFDRVRRNPRIRITYLCLADEPSPSKHLRSIGDSLLTIFQRLELSSSDSVIGRDLEYEVVDGELIFTVEFPIHLIPVEDPLPKIQILESHVDLK